MYINSVLQQIEQSLGKRHPKDTALLHERIDFICSIIENLRRIHQSVELLQEKVFNHGDFTMSIQFASGDDEHYEGVWIDASIFPTGDPGNDLSCYCGEALTMAEAIISLIEEMEDPGE